MCSIENITSIWNFDCLYQFTYKNLLVTTVLGTNTSQKPKIYTRLQELGACLPKMKWIPFITIYEICNYRHHHFLASFVNAAFAILHRIKSQMFPRKHAVLPCLLFFMIQFVVTNLFHTFIQYDAPVGKVSWQKSLDNSHNLSLWVHLQA